jgi:hypothetical protein
MKLTSETILHGVSKALREQIGPSLTDPFAIEATRLATLLVSIAANGIDDAAAARIWENTALRKLFGDAAGVVTGNLSAQLAAASQSVDPGYKLSELDAENGRLRNLLIKLHAFVEDRDEGVMRAMNQKIWKLLIQSHERRAPRM